MTKKNFKIYKSVIIWIAIMIVVMTVGVIALDLYLEKDERSYVDRLLLDSKAQIREATQAPLYRNYTIASHVVARDGNYTKLAIDAPSLMMSTTMFIGLYKDGELLEAYPSEVHDHFLVCENFNSDIGITTSNLKNSKSFAITGPYKCLEMSDFLVGWLPVFMDTSKSDNELWGFTFVGVDFNKVIEEVGLEQKINDKGYDFRLYNFAKDGSLDFIFEGNNNYDSKYAEIDLELSDNPIYLRIIGLKHWYSFTEIWIFIAISLIILAAGCIFLPQHSMLVRQKELLESQLVRDILTGILNRRGLGIEVERLIRLDKKFVTYFLDLDHFKAINDKFGHDVGDKALKLFTSVVDRHLDGSHIFARSGGDEFILVHVVNDWTNEDSMNEFFDRVNDSLQKNTIIVGKNKITLSFSRGSARYPEDGATFADVLRKADLEMYKNKKHTY